ncbi:hypothetical protein [Acetivibrio saccincola]|jgi:hypothetical protein|uniref:Uncharacterized protein n=1 Tax=Acetivibrio saccincola TaxID=1677857 RepID=A0A2K9E188_9FIRM|nr:hypothetical protein [Acetivibrio saccincola]AUG56118.1 hypothetical protein HVS_00710 [Acetivibrio saccincola]
MKKLYFMKFILLILICILVGCSGTYNTKTAEQYLPIRVYVMQESQEPIKPSVSLKDNNRFTFNYSALSSYIAIGSYEVNDDNLILKTDDGKFKYVFKIKDDQLIFNAAESSKIPSYANVPDGAIFK